MKYLQHSDPRFRNLGYKVGGFLLVVLVLVLVMAVLMGWRRDFFQAMEFFESYPRRAEQLTPGMDVTLHGIRVGRVVSVDLDEEGKPKMTLRLRKNVVRWLSADASLLLMGLEPLGDPYIAIEPGKKETGRLEAGMVLPFERSLTIGETIAKLEEEVTPVIHEAFRFVQDLSRPEGEIKKSLGDIQLISASLTQDLPVLLRDARQTAQMTRELLEEVQSKDGDVRKTRESLLAIASSVDRSLPGMIESVEGSLGSLRRTTAQIENATKVSTTELQELVRTSQLTSEKADSLIEDFRKIWILKLLMPVKARGKMPAKEKKP